MKIEDKIIAATPKDTQINKQFTETVMHRVTAKKAHKGRFVGILRKSPLLAVFAAVIALAAVSATTYAVVNYIWPQQHVDISSLSSSSAGRQQYNVGANDCSSPVSNGDVAGKYELKKNATITTDQITDVVKAYCNEQAIQAWVSANYPETITDGVMKATGASLARTVASITADSLSFSDTDSQGVVSVPLTTATKIIVNRQLASYQDIHTGDAVMYVTSTKAADPHLCTNAPCESKVLSSEVVAVIKLDLPYANYGKFNNLTKLDVCEGNGQDICHNDASIDIYEGSATVPDTEQTSNAGIEGVLKSHNTSGFTIQTTSGRIFTITTTGDLIENFNATRAANYSQYATSGTMRITNGDTISLMYNYTVNQPSTTINQSRIWSINLRLEMVGKGDTLTKF